MDLIALAAALSVMGAIIAAMLALYQSTANPRQRLQRRLGSVLGETQALEAVADLAALRPKRTGRTPIISDLLHGKLWTAAMAEKLERGEIKLTVSEFVSLRILLGLALAAVAAVSLGPTPPGILATGAAIVVGWMAPGFWVSWAGDRRLRKLEHQLIEALSLISSALKSGFGLMQSFELAARQMDHPIATELRRTLHDINVGASTDSALQSLAKRTGSKDFDIVVTAMLIQQTTGGNLAEILDTVAHTMRERLRIKGEIATLTSQQMLTGFIIGGLPFAMALGFSIISPDYMKPLIHTTIGNVMLAGATLLELFGIFLIKQILSIEV